MQTFISILRGINVGGYKKILMTDLKSLYETLRFDNVITYIQSGNVIFNTDKNKSDTELAAEIEYEILAKYGFNVPVIIRSLEEMKNTLSVNPFQGQKGINPEKLHVTFLSEVPGEKELTAIVKYDYPPDKFSIIGSEVYLHCPNGYGTSKLNNNFFESKLKMKATTRNWNTVNKLVELANEIK